MMCTGHWPEEEQRMKSIVNKLLVGASALAIATVPLAASAQSWHDGGGNRGGYHTDDNRHDHRGGARYDVGYAAPVYQRPFYRQPYVNGYFGWAPGGFQGYYWNGFWYQHRRSNGGVWIYF
jgi:hypothetical protein